jgi:hypothetical protein
MAIEFPSFDPGTTPTLLDSAEAQKVKTFIEAWNDAKIIPGSVDRITISDSNVIITYASSASAGASTELHYNTSPVQIDIDGNGIVVTNLSNGKKLTINPSLITHDMGIRTISICSSGTTKSMDILASAPY